MKECFKCHRTLPLEEFYRHPRMTDGHLGKCKECTKLDVQQHYAANREKMAEYDRRRDRTPERRKQRREALKRHRQLHPERNSARQKANKAIAAGRLTKQPCQVCGASNAQKHHPDYNQPLLVNWLCFACHQKAHGKAVR